MTNTLYPKTAVYISSVIFRSGYYDCKDDLANLLCVHVSTVEKWMNGNSRPCMQNLLNLKRTLPRYVDFGLALKYYQEDDDDRRTSAYTQAFSRISADQSEELCAVI